MSWAPLAVAYPGDNPAALQAPGSHSSTAHSWQPAAATAAMHTAGRPDLTGMAAILMRPCQALKTRSLGGGSGSTPVAVRIIR